MFHKNFKAFRKDRGFSQEQMAVRLNVVRQTVSKWERSFGRHFVVERQLLNCHLESS